MYDEVVARVEKLSPETRALFWEIEYRGEQAEYFVPPDELVVRLHQRMSNIPLHEQAEFVDIYRTIARRAHEEGRRLQAEEED